MSTTRGSVAAWLFRAVVLGVTSLAASGAGAEPIPFPETVLVPAGPFIAGSDDGEREAAYRLDEQAYGHSRTREQGWYDREHDRQEIELAAYRITPTPITNAHYEAFVAATGHRSPSVTAEEWESYGLIHLFERTVGMRDGPVGR